MALKLDSISVQALLQRGIAYQRSNKLDLAKADFDRALEIEPKNAVALLSRGNLRSQQRNWPEAISDFDEAIAARQDFAQAYVSRGRAHSESGQLDKALSDLNAAIAINVNVPAAFYWRGQTFRRKGDIEHAIEDFSRAIAQGPKNDMAPYFARAQLYSSKGDYTRALADLDAVLAVAPDSAAAKQLRQSTLAMQTELAKVQGNDKGSDNKPKALSAPSASPSTSPPTSELADQITPPLPQTAPSGNSPKPLIDRARQLIVQAKYADAVGLLNQVLTADPRDEAALQLRSSARTRLGQLAEARADLDELIKLRPNDATALALRGVTSAAIATARPGPRRRRSGTEDQPQQRTSPLQPRHRASAVGESPGRAGRFRSRDCDRPQNEPRLL